MKGFAKVLVVATLAIVACCVGVSLQASADDLLQIPAVEQGSHIAYGQWLPIGSSPQCTCPRCGHTWPLPYAVRAYDQFGNVTHRWLYQYAPVRQFPRYQFEYRQRDNRPTFLRELPHVAPAK